MPSSLLLSFPFLFSTSVPPPSPGTAHGQADAFSLDALTRLDDTKDLTNKLTLFQYVVELAVKKNSPALGLFDSMPSVHDAMFVNLQTVQRTVDQLGGELKSEATVAEVPPACLSARKEQRRQFWWRPENEMELPVV